MCPCQPRCSMLCVSVRPLGWKWNRVDSALRREREGVCVCVCVCVCVRFVWLHCRTASSNSTECNGGEVASGFGMSSCFLFSFSFFFLGSRLGLDYQSTLGISASLAERAMALGCRELPQAGLFAKLLTDGHRRVVCQSGKA